MSRVSLVLVFGFSTAVASGQQLRSFYAKGDFDYVVVDPIPAGGFVLTDILLDRDSSTGAFFIYAGATGSPNCPDANIKVSFKPQGTVSLRSGVLFAEGTQIRLRNDLAVNNNHVTLLGYVPGTSTGNAPVVGQWGMILLVTCILGAGAVMFSRQRVPSDRPQLLGGDPTAGIQRSAVERRSQWCGLNKPAALLGPASLLSADF